jgi:hypothetical protein
LSSCSSGDSLNLRETYDHQDKNPFGSSAAREIIETLFGNATVTTTSTQFSHINHNSEDTGSLYMCISRNFYPSENDVQSILEYIYEGNTAFISASFIDSAMLSRLICSVVNFNMLFNNIPEAYRSTSLSFPSGFYNSEKQYHYFYYPFANYFSKIGAANTRVTGYNANGLPNSFVYFGGKGKLILHCDPRAFSNYFLLTAHNYEYLTTLLSIIRPPAKIYWDNYYQKRNMRSRNSSGSALDEIMKYPPLKAAFWVFVALLLMYIFFNLKRKQRIIPVIEPNENSSVAFAETISRLYLQQKDHKSIADKMIVYFYEHVKSNYFISKGPAASMIPAVSRKSGVPEPLVATLFETMDNLQDRTEINEQDLLLLNDQIQQFFKTKK